MSCRKERHIVTALGLALISILARRQIFVWRFLLHDISQIATIPTLQKGYEAASRWRR